MVLEPASPFSDQRVARVRAANFFALSEALGKPQDVEAAWIRAAESLDLSAPFAAPGTVEATASACVK
jgi:hypothetical protein